MDFTKLNSKNYKFGRLKNIVKNEIELSMLKQEIRDGWKLSCADIIINEIQKLYILYIKPNFIKELEKYISREKYEYLIQNNKGIVAGYILFYKTTYNPNKIYKRQNIRFCDTVISKLNILRQMIEVYSNRYNMSFILPYESLSTSVKYWERYLQEVYDLNNKEELIEFKNKNNLNILIDNYFI